MSLIRRLLLPAVIGTPLVLWVMPVAIRGFGSLAEFDVGEVRGIDWAWAFGLNVAGLLLIGLPAAKFVASRGLPTGAKTALLLTFGAGGGGLVAILYYCLLAVLAAASGEELDFSTFKEVFLIAPFGFLPGAIVTVVWVALNFDRLKGSSKQHA